MWLTARAEVPLDRFIVALFSPSATINVSTRSEFGLFMRSYGEETGVWRSLDSIISDSPPRDLCFAVNGSEQSK